MLYRNDKLGFGSPNTGFMFFFKQGHYNLITLIFNNRFLIKQLMLILQESIKLIHGYIKQALRLDTLHLVLWKQVENVYADAYLQTESSDKKIFSVGSRANDEVTYVFGDGVFSEMPVGNFRAFVRSSNALTYTIDPSEMNGVAVSMTYVEQSRKQSNI